MQSLSHHSNTAFVLIKVLLLTEMSWLFICLCYSLLGNTLCPLSSRPWHLLHSTSVRSSTGKTISRRKTHVNTIDDAFRTYDLATAIHQCYNQRREPEPEVNFIGVHISLPSWYIFLLCFFFSFILSCPCMRLYADSCPAAAESAATTTLP